MPRDNAVTDQNLGAWVIKCNPAVWDLRRYMADRKTLVEDWSVVNNYRSAMMQQGQRVLLWVTGPEDAPLARGFWGSGWITGTIFEYEECGLEPAGELGPHIATMDDALEDGDYWIDLDARDRMLCFAPLDVHLWDRPITEAKVKAVPGLDQIEVIRMRQTSNPSWINTDQLAALDPLLPPWPAVAPEAEKVISAGPTGAGFGDPNSRAIVELAAMAAVTDHYKARGYTVDDVGAQKCGWEGPYLHRQVTEDRAGRGQGSLWTASHRASLTQRVSVSPGR